jgi:hypothetical protein
MIVKFSRVGHSKHSAERARKQAKENGCWRSKFRINPSFCTDPTNIGILGICRVTGKDVSIMNDSFLPEDLHPHYTESAYNKLVDVNPAEQLYPIFN